MTPTLLADGALSYADRIGGDFYHHWLDYSDTGGHLPYAAWLIGFVAYCDLLADCISWSYERRLPLADAPKYGTLSLLARQLKLETNLIST